MMEITKLVLLSVLAVTANDMIEVHRRERRSFPSGLWRDISNTPMPIRDLTRAQIQQRFGNNKWDHWPSKRQGATTTVNHDRRKIMLFGGSGYLTTHDKYHCVEPLDALDDLWEFSLEELYWKTVPTAGAKPSGRMYHTAFQMDHKMYVFGGATIESLGPAITNTTYLSDFWVYDPTAGGLWTVGSWQDITPTSSDTTLSEQIECLNEWGYQSGENDCESSSTMYTGPSARHSTTTSTWREHVYMFGGCNSSGAMNDFHHYSTDTGLWNQMHPCAGCHVPEPRYGHSAVFLDDESLYVFGGQRGGPGVDAPALEGTNGLLPGQRTYSPQGSILKDLWKYIPRTNTWKEIAQLPAVPPTDVVNHYFQHWPSARSGHVASGVLSMGHGEYHSNRNKHRKMVVFGGWGGNNTYLNDVWEFEQGTQTWKKKQCNAKETHTCSSVPAPPPRWRAAGCAYHNMTMLNTHLGTSMYITGGVDSPNAVREPMYDMYTYYV